MATPDPSQPLDAASVLARLDAVETAVQELRFVHVVKVDAVQSGLGIMYGQLQHLQQEVTGFRAEVAAEFGALKSDVSGLKDDVTGLKSDVTVLKSDVSGLKSDMVFVKDSLAEILRRLPPPADQ